MTIIPFTSQKVLGRIPVIEHAENADDVKLLDDPVLTLLKEMAWDNTRTNARVPIKSLNVEAGKDVYKGSDL